jgi:ribosomal protein S18 acetylase RimI-like enzyme
MEHIIRDYRKADNQGLADMWNQSQSAWPTGFGGNVAFTAQRVAEDMKKQQALFYLVAEDRGRIVGYCWVSMYPKEPDACYVALLNAHPDYHGQGVGKGLLLESIRRAVKRGYYRVDLHTWPSNIKAVPLYKKTGFFWLPDTQVHMQNYIPAALAHPLCREFFSKHDWYRTFVRKLDQEPDEIKIGKRRVFPYRFQAGEEYVEVTFDMESRRACAVETNRVKAGLRLDNPEVVVGRRQKVEIKGDCGQGGRLKVAWLKPKNAKIGLRPSGREALLVVSPDVEAPEEQMPALTVGARVEMDGKSFKLEAGIRPKQSLELEWIPKYPDFSVRERVPVSLSMVNNTDEKAKVSLDIRHQKDVRSKVVHIGRLVYRDGKTGCLVETAKTGKGVGEMLIGAKVRAGREILSTKNYRVPLFNIGHGQKPALWHGERKTVWETPGFRAEVIRRGGEVDLTDKASGRYLASIDSSLGPPFWPNEFANIECRVSMKGHGLLISSVSQQTPGLVFQRVLEMSGERALRITTRVINKTRGSGRYQVNLSVPPGLEGPGARKVFPLKQACIGIAGPHPFGGLGKELPQKPEGFSEKWWAVESDGLVSGIVWEDIQSMDYPSMVLDVGPVKPGATGQTAAVTVIFGPGDHNLVRRNYLEKHKGLSLEDVKKLEVQPRLSAAFEPPALFLTPGKAQSRTFLVRNLNHQEMEADLKVIMPGMEGLTVRAPSVKLGKDFRQGLDLPWMGDAPSTGEITGRVGINAVGSKFGIVPVAGDGEAVRVFKTEEQGLEVWVADNGLCRFKVSPGFLGSLFSWTFEGREQLLSAFPTPGNFSWERPWYGGITPVLHQVESWGRNLLIKERFSGSEAEVKGKTGLVWRGVKITCRPVDKITKGLLAEVSYLTLPRCPVMAAVASFRNTTAGCMHFNSELIGFVSPGGGYHGTRLLWDESGRERQVLRGDKGAWAESGRWGAAENPESGEALVMAIPSDQSSQAVLMMDYGRDGGHLGQGLDIRLKAGETKSFLGFWGAAKNTGEVEALKHMAELKLLP